MLASYRVSRRRDDSLRRMPRRSVPLRAISALFLQRQHLSAPRTTGLTAPRLGRFVEDVGGIQMDSINVLDGAVVSTEEFQRWHLERSLHAMGAATERDLAGYLTFPRFQRGARTAALRAMVERGEVAPIEVEGSSARWLTLTRDLPALSRAVRAS